MHQRRLAAVSDLHEMTPDRAPLNRRLVRWTEPASALLTGRSRRLDIEFWRRLSEDRRCLTRIAGTNLKRQAVLALDLGWRRPRVPSTTADSML